MSRIIGGKRLRRVSNNFYVDEHDREKEEISSLKKLIEVEERRKAVKSVRIPPLVLLFRWAWFGWSVILSLVAIADHLGATFRFFPVLFSFEEGEAARVLWPEKLAPLLAVRFGGAIVTCLIVFGLSFAKVYLLHLQLISSLGCVFCGVCIIALQVICQRIEYGVLIIYLFFVNFFSRLFFLPAACISLALYGGFLIAYGLQLSELDVSFVTYFVNDAGLSLLAILAMLYVRYIQEKELRREYLRHTLISVEEKKTSVLLSALLPRSVAEQLSRGEHGKIVDIAPDTTLLFLDIVSFTKLSSGITSTQLMAMLNNVYSTFDDLADKYKVYKVETIGDAYIAVSGLQRLSKGGRRDHASSIAEMALAMVEAIPAINRRNLELIGQEINIRIGIHSGPSIAGVLGLKMPRYHLWGEAVTIANSLQESGSANQILVSDATRQLLGEDYIFEEFDTSQSPKIMVQKAFWLRGKQLGRARRKLQSERSKAPHMFGQTSGEPEVLIGSPSSEKE